MKLLSFNVNGIRAAVNKGIVDNINSYNPDFICIQETKCQQEQIPDIFNNYYKYNHSAIKKGYSGTLIFAKEQPISIYYGLNNFNDDEGRVVTLEYNNYYLVNVYVPNSQNELVRLPYRRQWNEYFRQYLLSLNKPVLVCGDFNVAASEIDIKNPKANEFNPGYTIEERTDFKKLLDSGFVDTFRYLYPDSVKYSWWSYRFKAREKNIGWRIDYWLVSDSIKDLVINSDIKTDWLGSDHAPVVLEIDL